MRAHMETVSVGAGAGGGAPHNGCTKPLNCRATSISVVGLRLMVVLRRMDTCREGGREWKHINGSTIPYKRLHEFEQLLGRGIYSL